MLFDVFTTYRLSWKNCVNHAFNKSKPTTVEIFPIRKINNFFDSLTFPQKQIIKLYTKNRTCRMCL